MRQGHRPDQRNRADRPQSHALGRRRHCRLSFGRRPFRPFFSLRRPSGGSSLESSRESGRTQTLGPPTDLAYVPDGSSTGDKRELYLETLKRYREKTRAGVARLLQESPTFRDFLRKYYAAALDIYLGGGEGGRGCYSISTAGTQAAVDPAVRDYLAESIRATDTFMAARIRSAVERGEIASRADPDALAQLATATLHTLAIRSRAGASREQLIALAFAAIDTICGPEPSKAP